MNCCFISNDNKNALQTDAAITVRVEWIKEKLSFRLAFYITFEIAIK